VSAAAAVSLLPLSPDVRRQPKLRHEKLLSSCCRALVPVLDVVHQLVLHALYRQARHLAVEREELALGERGADGGERRQKVGAGDLGGGICAGGGGG